MSWISAFVELNKSLLLKGLLLLMAFLLGLQMGESRLQRRWDAEKQIVQIAQAKQEQHAANVFQVQNQISNEISDDYRKKSSLLASRTVVSVRVFDKSSSGGLFSISDAAGGPDSTITNPVLTSGGNEEKISCEQLIQDATRTTLILDSIQSWYDRQSMNSK
jgi:hypothetical protein